MATPGLRVNGVDFSSLISSSISTGDAGLWWDGSTLGPLWRKADGTDIRLQSATTLQGAYSAGSAGSYQTITLDGTRNGIDVKGDYTILSGSATYAFRVSSGGGVAIFGVAGDSIDMNPGLLRLTNSTPRLDFNASGISGAAPSFNAAGTDVTGTGERITLARFLDATHVNVAIGNRLAGGGANGNMWLSVPRAVSTDTFEFYGGTTLAGTLTGNGNFSIAGTFTLPVFSGTATGTYTLGGTPTLVATSLSLSNLLTTQTSGLNLTNPTAADAVNTQQNSPCAVFSGSAWNSTAVASQMTAFYACNTPSGGATISSALRFYSQLNGGAVTETFRIASSGQIIVQGSAFLGNAADNSGNLGGSASRPAQIWGMRHMLGQSTVAAATTTTISTSTAGGSVRLTLGTNISTMTISAGLAGEILTLELIQDATGGRTLPASWTNVVFAGGAYTVTATLNKRDVLEFVWDATDTKWLERSRSQNL